jgi:hypothetical protein
MHSQALLSSGTIDSAMPVAPVTGWSNQGAELKLGDARKRFGIIEKLDSVTSRYSAISPEAKVRVIEGDLIVDGPLLCDWNQGHAAAGLVITGSLTVRGPIINSNVNDGPFLLVVEQTRAHAIIGGGAEFMFLGEAVVDEIVVGEYNDGILRFGSSLTVPVAITNDHHFEVAGGVRGRWLDPFNEGHSWAAVLHPDLHVNEDGEGTEEFDVMVALVPRLLAGVSVLRSDLPPVEEFPESFE